jgi:hypothetical protein
MMSDDTGKAGKRHDSDHQVVAGAAPNAPRAPELEAQDAETAPVRLTTGQAGAVRSLLTQIARVVEQYEAARGEPLSERLEYVRTEQRLTHDERQQVDSLVEELIREANALARRAAAPPIVRATRAQLRSEFLILWSDVEDVTPRRLVAYGPVAAPTATALGPGLARMAQLALEVSEGITPESASA